MDSNHRRGDNHRQTAISRYVERRRINHFCEPLGGYPWVTGRAEGKWICSGNATVLENPAASSDMPADVAIAKYHRRRAQSERHAQREGDEQELESQFAKIE